MPLRTASIVGSGPNGLAAAITLAQAGVSVTIFERNAQHGGACTTSALTLPGFHHDVGSSVYPLGIASPFFRTIGLERFGLEWIHPPAAVAHPLDNQPALTLEPSLAATAEQLDHADRAAYNRLLAPGIRDWDALLEDVMQPLLRWPSHPVAMATFGIAALWPARALGQTLFRGERARALLAGCAAHSVIPLTSMASAASGLVLETAGHTTGWPIVRGGAGRLADALLACFVELGGKIVLNAEIGRCNELPPADVTLFDTSLATMQQIAGEHLSMSYRRRLAHTQPGPGIFKLDYALSGPIPWRDAACTRAATVHLGGSMDEIALSEHDASTGRHPERPFVLLVQPSLFDPSRAPAGRHTAWAYCHVPFGSTLDGTEAIERQIERFAPGFRDVVLARKAWNSTTLAEWNPNLRGGDLSGGAMTLAGMLARPTVRGCRTSNPRLYLASSAAPPGGGVHGMCGHLAAKAALSEHGHA